MKAVAYLHRGAAYNNRGDHDLAIADINETLKLAPSDPLMKIMGFFYRGCAHDDKGDEDKAIKDFSEALGPGLPHKYMIDLKAQIHFRRGLAYQSKDDNIQAFKDFVEADNCDPVLKTKIPPIYIAVQIADSYKNRDEEGRAESMYCIWIYYLQSSRYRENCSIRLERARKLLIILQSVHSESLPVQGASGFTMRPT